MIANLAVLAGSALIALGTGLVVAGVVRGAVIRRAAVPARRRRPVDLDDYGLLRPVAFVADHDTGRSVRDLLRVGGVRATIATGHDGLIRVLVFPDQYDRARQMVSWVL